LQSQHLATPVRIAFSAWHNSMAYWFWDSHSICSAQDICSAAETLFAEQAAMRLYS